MIREFDCTGECTPATNDGLCHACGMSHRAIRNWERLSPGEKQEEINAAKARKNTWQGIGKGTPVIVSAPPPV